MRFNKFYPCPALQPYIRYFAIFEAESEQTYKVIPSSSIVMGIQYKGTLHKIQHTSSIKLAQCGITGLQDTYQLFSNSENTGTVLIYFTETGASKFFSIPLNVLFSESISLDNFIKASLLTVVQEQLEAAVSDKERIMVVEKFLVSQFNNTNEDTIITEAVRMIKATNGIIRIKELAQQLNTSQSPLEKRFRSIVGASPKKFASVIRLQTALENYGRGNNLTELGYTAGYYDQSHFIKDFKKLTGETPDKYFSAK